MGYSVREAVADADRRLVFYRQLLLVYPDAAQEGELWCAHSLQRADCDGFELEPDSKSLLTYVRFYRTLGEGRVYVTWEKRIIFQLFLDDLWRKDEAYHSGFLQRLKAFRP